MLLAGRSGDMDDMESVAVFVDGDVDMNVTATPDNSSVNLPMTAAPEQYGGFVGGDVDVFEGELTEPTEWTAKGLCHV